MILRRSPALLLIIVVTSSLLGACGNPVSEADAATRAQYLQVAAVAESQAGLNISDEDWLDFAVTICNRRLLTEADYETFLTEMEAGAPDAPTGRAAKDVGRTAIQLFCPFR